jgi:hypothetical protein
MMALVAMMSQKRIRNSFLELFFLRLVGFLPTFRLQVWARDYWHWSRHDNRWNRRADLRGDYQDLEEAKRQPEQIDAIMRDGAKSPKMRHQSGISNIHADRRGAR